MEQNVPSSSPTLEEQRRAFTQRRFLAMPLAGAIAWSAVGMAGLVWPLKTAAWVLFGATGSIAYLGMFLSRYTGENFLDKNRPSNPFDALFFHGVATALFVYAIAIPFFLIERSSLPLSVGILTGLMWVPLSWIIGHWVGIFHTAVRTALITVVWYLLPGHRFVAVPAVIVVVYAVTIAILERRWRRL